MSTHADPQPWWRRLWASRWPEAGWLCFALGNLAWIILSPSSSMLPYHFTWMSLLLLYGLGVRTWSRKLTWLLVAPVMTATGLLFLDPRISGVQPYDELIELPMMVLMLFVMTRLTNRRQAAMERLDAVSRHNLMLLERQRAFVQNASHALRTPITIALAHTELLEPAVSGCATQDVSVVLDELGRLRKSVDQLLMLATAEQTDSLHCSPTPLRPILEDLLRRWEAVPRKWLLSPGSDATVLADPEQLVMAFDALLDNAVRFTEEGDTIELSVDRRDQEAVVTVADAGPGIPEENLEAVFERFETRPAPHQHSRNFGLGLSLVRAVSQAHGGSVLAGRSELGGAAVSVRLPLFDSAADPVPVAAGGTSGAPRVAPMPA